MGLFRPVAGQLYFYCVVVNVENTFLSFGWNSSLYSVEKFVCNCTLYILIFVVKSGVLTIRSSLQRCYECSDINSAYVLVNVILTCYCTCSVSALPHDIPHRPYAILYGCGWLSLIWRCNKFHRKGLELVHTGARFGRQMRKVGRHDARNSTEHSQ